MNRALLAATAAVFALAGSHASFGADKKTLAFVVNGASDFWRAAKPASRRRKANCRTTRSSSSIPSSRLPPSRRASWTTSSPPARRHHGELRRSQDHGRALNRIGGQVALFTTDSDSPRASASPISAFCNVDAGKQAGQLMLKALPNGGKCMGFVGLPGADNAHERIEGVKGRHQGIEDRAGGRARRRHRPDARQAQRRGHAHPDRKSTAWSASTPTTRRGSTRR